MNKSHVGHRISEPDDSVIQDDHWNSKLEVLAETLRHHIEEEDQLRTGPNGMYIDFQEME